MASNQDIDLAFQRSGVGRSATSSDYNLYSSNPFFSDAGKVEGDLRAGGGGRTYNDYQTNQAKAQTDALAAQQKQAMDQKFTTDKQDLSNFNTAYTNATNQTIGDTSSKYHLPDLVNITNALDTRIKQLSGNTNNAGAEGMASAGQVDQAIGSRYLPQFNQAVTNQANATQAAQTEENQLLKPYQVQGQLLNDRLAREMTGFNDNQQRELEGLLGSINAGVTLTTAQQQRANELAIAEEGYQNALNVARTQNQNITLQPGSTYYNPSTGQAYNPFTKVG